MAKHKVNQKYFITLMAIVLSIFTLMSIKLQGRLNKGSVKFSNGNVFKYRLFKPHTTKGKHPLLLVLHGAGERGSDNFKPMFRIGIRRINRIVHRYNSYVLLPQCPEDLSWAYVPHWDKNYNFNDIADPEFLNKLINLIKSLTEEYSIDYDRIYVLGHSMGGGASWGLMIRNPEVFAAGMPLSTNGDPYHGKELSRIPIWFLIGENDEFIKPEYNQVLYDSLSKYNSNIKFTILKGERHGIFQKIIDTPEYLDWLFSQNKTNN